MGATRSEATRSGRVRQVGLLFCSGSEAISPKAVPQGSVAGTGILGRGSGDTRARRRSVSDAFLESKLKWLLSWLSCGVCGREARECGQRGGRRPCVVHGLSTRPDRARAGPQGSSTNPQDPRDRFRQTSRPGAGSGSHCPSSALSARIDEPCSSKRIAPWTRRSRMASAIVGSATV